MRRLVAENELSVNDLVYPLFTCPGTNVKEPIASMDGCFHLSPDLIVKEAVEVASLGIPAVLIFGLPEGKDATGSQSADPNGPVQQAIRGIKKAAPDLLVITDVCLCAYTDHGHCGVLEDDVMNDPSLPLLAAMAVAHADAGADWVAPSDMMDGRVAALRDALDDKGHDQVAILSYAVKYASAMYGPFRSALDSAPRGGDKKTYQMDPGNRREALREVALDIREGADITQNLTIEG